MKFVSFSALSAEGLNRKINRFLGSRPEIELLDLKFSASFGSVYAAILYR